jgi:Tfp pilus assembly protein PilF
MNCAPAKVMEEEKSRLEQFKEFVASDPNDTFSRYALALEYMGIDHFPAAIEQFQEVIRIDRDYSAAYFQAAICAKNLQQLELAKNFLRGGIQAAEKKGDWHARDEMQAALDDLE